MDNRIFKSGKYIGALVDEVVEKDPSYIIFCYENEYYKFIITEDDYEAAKENIEALNFD